MRDSLKDLTVDVAAPTRELNISFGYQRNSFGGGFSRSSSISSFVNVPNEDPDSPDQSSITGMKHRSGSFSCLSGAALSANATLANTNILGDEILPNLDSPNSFRRLTSSPSLSRLSDDSTDRSFPRSSDSSSFLNSMDVVQTAGGAAGEDRVQAVCSEENGWLFCGIYDGFNGRDAADFLAATLYETVACSLKNLEWRAEEVCGREEAVDDFVRAGVVECLKDAVCHAESGFLHRVEEEMEDRPDLVSVGTCVLVGLLYGDDIYVLNLGDSRAILATEGGGGGGLRAVQMSETHTVDNEAERIKVVADHPDDPRPIKNGRLKGKLKVTRAFGVGYLKQARMNDMLMGILRIENLCSPPYVYSDPYTTSHRVSENDHFIVLGSDGLFDFFKNEEIVKLVHLFIQHNPLGDPAKYLVELLVQRAAHNAGISAEELLTIPLGRRRKYHDDVTVIVIILGNKQRTSTASTSLS